MAIGLSVLAIIPMDLGLLESPTLHQVDFRQTTATLSFSAVF